MLDEISIVKKKLTEAISQLCEVLIIYPEKTANLTRLPFRVVRFQIADGVFETVDTNLDRCNSPASELKKLYNNSVL